jgi:subtilisin family serine protease
MRRMSVVLLFVCAMVAGGLPALAAAPGDGAPSDRIEEGLLERLASGDLDRVVVDLVGRADLRSAQAKHGTARTQAVIDALQAEHARSAPGVVMAAHRAGARATGYWLTNTVIVDGATEDLVRSLARDRNVSLIRTERIYPLVEPVERTAVVEIAEADAEWGVTTIRANEAWEQGVLGGGVVVANVDTGVDYLHEALVEQYRGNNHDGSFTHDYNWWDPSGICGDEPCDNAEHGTHTMGTMVGGDGPGPFTPDIGVAPGATWIAAKGCEDLFCTEESLLSSGEWILAPTDSDGLNPDPAKRPDIVNNSWGGGPGDDFYLETVTAWRAAGIIPIFSSGNPGPQCGQGGSPGDFVEVISVGATDSNDMIADFSGRGPSVFGKVNPDVAAPGVDVLSSVPGGYAEFSGTSMAAPHTAGTLALMLSAEPSLIGDFEGAHAALTSTAMDILDDSCGGDDDLDPNNVYGDGRIDAAEAVALVATGGTLAGTITDDDTTDPIAGANVTATSQDTGRSYRGTSASDGTYSMFLPAGTYDVVASAFAYESGEAFDVLIETDLTTPLDLALVPLPRYDVSGVVRQAEDGEPIPGATVHALATPLAPAVADGAGTYALSLPAGTWTLRGVAGGCTQTVDVDVEVVDGPVSQDLDLPRKIDDFGHVCAPIDFDWVDAANESSIAGNDTFGRFNLPFAFDFYGTSYSRVYVTTNGYVTFTDPEYADGFPVTPPVPFDPKPSIFALWQDLEVDDDAHIDTETVGISPDRAFVIEMQDVLAAGKRVDLQIKLWEDGTIDLLYGDNPSVADGRFGVIGLQSPDGDAFVFSAFTSSVTPMSAFRFTEADLATIRGTVTDANDGLAVVGAAATTMPGGRTTTTDDDGMYEMTVLPGSYDLTVSGNGYVSQTVQLTVIGGDDVLLDFVLDAPVATLAPDAIDVTHAVTSVTTTTVTIGNEGTAPLHWELRERRAPQPSVEPEVTGTGITRQPTWGRATGGPAPTATTSGLGIDELEVVIDDPVGDAFGVDVDDVLGGVDESEVTLALRMASAASVANMAGYLFLDTDQDQGTGVPPADWAGDPAQDIGVDIVLDLFDLSWDGSVYVVDPVSFEFLGAVTATIDGADVLFSIPLDMLYGDDGSMDIAGVIGDWFQPTDWVPDAGHGTLEPFTDLPWITPLETSGVLDPGQTVDVDVELGTADLQPGDYEGLIVLVSDAPRAPRINLPVSLTVPMPASWGHLSGFVVDARTGAPVDASILLSTQWSGSPYPVAVEAQDGFFFVAAPQGTWPLAVSAPGYEGVTQPVTVIAGDLVDVFIELIPTTPQAFIDVEGIEILLEAGMKQSSKIVLTNRGPVPLTFSSGEVDLGVSSSVHVARTEPATDRVTGRLANQRTTRELGRSGAAAPIGVEAIGDVLTSWPTGLFLPWGVGYDGDVLISDPDQLVDARYTTAGEMLGSFDTPWAGDWAADMAFDPTRGWVWQVNVGGDNGIYGLDPFTGDVMDVITGSPWDDISQRGLAYDPDADVFYIGGWNEGIVYRVAGPSWPTPGETLSQCFPDDPNIAGLAYNRAFGALWMTTNSESDTIWLIDAASCGVGYTLPFPDGGGFLGAGIELDVVGNLWVASQMGDAYLVDSGLPVFSDVPWLSATPTEGVVNPGKSKTITLTADAAGLDLGTYSAMFVLTTDDPLASAVPVPVTLTVAEDVPGDDVVTINTVRNGAEPDVAGLVRVTRNEPHGSLTVPLRVGGTATSGSDFAALAKSVTFKDGQTRIDVPVTVIDDDIPEGPETVTVSVVDTGDFIAGTPGLAVVTIADDEAPLRPGVTRLSGTDRYRTAVAISQDAYPADGSAATVVLANGDNFPDGLAGGPLAVHLGGPLLLTPSGSLHEATRAEILRVLDSGGTVHVLGGAKSVYGRRGRRTGWPGLPG